MAPDPATEAQLSAGTVAGEDDKDESNGTGSPQEREDIARAGPNSDPSGNNSRAVSKWRKANFNVTMSLRLSNRLQTLRDQLGGLNAFVEWRQLTLKRLLGQGAFATVSQCSFVMPSGVQREVAVKQIHTELLSNPDEVRLFVQEVDLLRKLKHKYIVSFYGGGWTQETEEQEEAADVPPLEHQLFYLQEYMPGGSMHLVVLKAMTHQPGGKYRDADALRWALDIALALEYLHTRKPKVMHRDLKLENILLTSQKTSEAEAKLADFGLARLLQNASRRARQKSERLLRQVSSAPKNLVQQEGAGSLNDLLERKLSDRMSRSLSNVESDTYRSIAKEMTARTGSLGYMAPEVLRGEDYNEAADVFSYGVVLYNVFHRNIPTVHILLNGTIDDLEDYAHNVAYGYRPPLSKKLPPGVGELIERCWKGLPELRPTMSEVVEGLKGMQSQGTAAKAAAGGRPAVSAMSGVAKGGQQAEANGKECSCCCIS